jgi:hypothetical protein
VDGSTERNGIPVVCGTPPRMATSTLAHVSPTVSDPAAILAGPLYAGLTPWYT